MANYTLTQTGQEVQDLLNVIGTSQLTTTAQTLTGAVNELNTLSALSKIVYPVGSVLVTQTPTNPSGSYGGTWVLFDKEFAPDSSGQDFTSAVTVNTTNAQSFGLYVIRSDHSILLSGSFSNKVAFSESNLNLTTAINWSALGFSALSFRPRFSAYSDGGNAIAMLNLNATSGVIQYTDVVIKGGGTSVSAGQTWEFTVTCLAHYSNMLDSACNKFYWRRTA